MAQGKKKKGCLGVIIAVIALGVIVAAVGGSGDDDKSSDESKSAKVVVNSFDDSKNNGKVSKKQDSKDENKDESKDEKGGDVSQEANEVIYDDQGVKITYTGYSAAELFQSASINFLIENNSDKNITVENFNFNVNGYTLDTFFYEEVPAGKKSNVKLDISSSQLEENGIESLGTVDFELRAIDSDNYDELFITDNVSIVFDENASQEENIDDYQLVYEASDISVYYKGRGEDGILGSANFNFLVVNNSGDNITVSADNISVNDFAASSLFHADCAPGKKTNEVMTINSDDLEKNNIEDIEKLEFDLRCYNSGNYQDIWEAKSITVELDK